jgi:hypothetical protein
MTNAPVALVMGLKSLNAIKAQPHLGPGGSGESPLDREARALASPGNLPSRTPWCVGLSSG